MAITKGVGREHPIGGMRNTIEGSFRPNSSSGIVTGSDKGMGYTVARISAGLYRLTFAETLRNMVAAHASVRDAYGRRVQVQMGDYVAASKTIDIRVDSPVGHIPLDINTARLIVSNVIINTSEAGFGDGNTAPILQRVNSGTDIAMRLAWVANGVEEIQFGAVPFPADQLGNSDMTVNLRMSKGSNTDTAAVFAVKAFQGLAGSNIGGNTPALAVSTMATYSVTLTAANVVTYPNFLNVALVPGAHANDTIYLYSAWLEYVKEHVGYDMPSDTDNVVNFRVVTEESVAITK